MGVSERERPATGFVTPLEPLREREPEAERAPARARIAFSGQTKGPSSPRISPPMTECALGPRSDAPGATAMAE